MLILSIPADGSYVISLSHRDTKRLMTVLEVDNRRLESSINGHGWSSSVINDVVNDEYVSTIYLTNATDGKSYEVVIKVDTHSRDGRPGYRLSIDPPNDIIVSRGKKCN